MNIDGFVFSEKCSKKNVFQLFPVSVGQSWYLYHEHQKLKEEILSIPACNGIYQSHVYLIREENSFADFLYIFHFDFYIFIYFSQK